MSTQQEILEIVNQTLEKRGAEEADKNKQKDAQQVESRVGDVEMEPMQEIMPEATPAAVIATALDMTSAPISEIPPPPTAAMVATALDITSAPTAEIPLPTTSETVPVTMSATALDITTTASLETPATVSGQPNPSIGNAQQDHQYEGGVRATILDYSSKPDSDEAVKNEPEEQ